MWFAFQRTKGKSSLKCPVTDEPSPATAHTLKSSLRGPSANEKCSASIDKEGTSLPSGKVTSRGVKRRFEDSITEKTTAPKKIALHESSLQKKLLGALMSEQKIEVICKNLGEDVYAIARMDSNEFASTMVKCSLNLPSGDMWTIVQAHYRSSESSDIHNKKEDSFVNIAKELAGSSQVWVEYVK
ncbi:unnamed protein product [Strongylus vulgaris]|uniref:Uncharacterized protein n=1 Tax=Strongylus vulgaris TaxID=40348 RepID=A0A3P7IE89_STRVU|nr:unnamed protein product [Strongylus vulgaris]